MKDSNRILEEEIRRLKEENESLKAKNKILKSELDFNRKTFKNILNMMNESIMAFSADGYLIYANNLCKQIHGIDMNEKQYHVSELPFSFKTNEEFQQKLNDIRHGEDGKFTYRTAYYNEKLDMEGIFQVVTLIVEDAGHEEIWFFATDVTELVESRDKAYESNMLLNAIMDNVPVSLFVKDTGDDLKYLYWNKAFTKISSIPEQAALGHTDFDIFPNREDAEKFRRDDLQLLRTGERIELQESYLSANGEPRIVETVKVLVDVEKRAPLLVGVSLDITGLDKIEKELIQARIRAEESDRLKTAFLANMSHEIRTPLNAIVGFARLMCNSQNSADLTLYSEIIDQNSELLLQLINDILDLAKIESGTLSFVKGPMDMEEICRNQYEIHRSHIQDNVELIMDTPGKSPLICQDKNRIMQLYTNLINNALKFTKKGEIRFGYTIGEDNYIHGFVKDTGIGIAPENQKKVFERFVKLNSFAQGSGLGLSICQLIIDNLGGEITLKSELGKGTSFHFSFPIK